MTVAVALLVIAAMAGWLVPQRLGWAAGKLPRTDAVARHVPHTWFSLMQRCFRGHQRTPADTMANQTRVHSSVDAGGACQPSINVPCRMASRGPAKAPSSNETTAAVYAAPVAHFALGPSNEASSADRTAGAIQRR
jgi:hypothetical protein